MKVNKAVLVRLLELADRQWFASHPGQFRYREHLDFVGDFILRHAPRSAAGMKKLSQAGDDGFIEGDNRVPRTKAIAEPMEGVE